ncbi:hypothetical protein [Tenacibaculum sp. 190524A05c]|uniref:DUF3108 domain-containing protein n=1 Tax=Tenacibaculum platacis TaxID=3137852 RepID=A0ABM9NXF2_9FLAO
MSHNLKILLFSVFVLVKSFAQIDISPKHNTSNVDFLKSETYEMDWYMTFDNKKISIGNVNTVMNKEGDKIYLTTKIKMNNSKRSWIDSTIVNSKDFSPIYHSSYNQQRDIILFFGDNITGSYYDKQKQEKTQILEKVENSFFDSNFYPQLIRFLPLEEGYKSKISIFDYNPNLKIGVMTASIKGATEKIIEFKGKKRAVWEVQTTSDISDNSTTIIFYIDQFTREILKQVIHAKGRKMIMELKN